jgi:hypothetical protein
MNSFSETDQLGMIQKNFFDVNWNQKYACSGSHQIFSIFEMCSLLLMNPGQTVQAG